MASIVELKAQVYDLIAEIEEVERHKQSLQQRIIELNKQILTQSRHMNQSAPIVEE